MRILIGYNGSEASRAALCDLHYAGLPDETEALVLTVAESWSAPKTSEEARRLAAAGVAKIHQEFPKWMVSGETASGSPPREILARSERFKPNLILVGEPGHDKEQNMFMGHTSHILLSESESSVRISRQGGNRNGNGNGIAPRAQRLIVGFDGSRGAIHAVESIAQRRWSSEIQVKLLAVADSSVLDSIGRFTPRMANAVLETKFASQWAETLAADSLQTLANASISSSVHVRLGDPKQSIIDEAARWNADSIFVGPHCSGNSFERFLIGSVSAAVAARAQCSVEVVRR